MKDRYIYPAIFDYADDGISVEFPDLPGALTCGDNDEEALRMARECMALHLYGIERDGDVVPEPTRAIDVITAANQTVVLIEVWMPPAVPRRDGGESREENADGSEVARRVGDRE